MDEKQIRRLIENTQPQYQAGQQAIKAMENRVISRMVETAHQEKDRLEHHLLDMPLPVIIYQWVIIRLKYRPWRLLLPASVTLAVLLQGLLARLNILQVLTR
jgi:hypothetical protein